MSTTINPAPAGSPAPAPTPTPARPRTGLGDRLSTVLYRHAWLRLLGLLGLPMLWLGVLYLGSLALLLLTAFWTTDSFTSQVIPAFTWENFSEILTVAAYRDTALRTIGIALAVTVLCAVIAIPLGLYMAKIASPRVRTWLAIGITLPLWAGYLVKVFSWRITFSEGGPLEWLLAPLGLSGPGYGTTALVITLAYLWFPYMAVPVYTAFRSIPDNLFEASADLGGKAWRTVFSVALPLLKPALIAGSIFTFSLSLGDYIAAQFVGGKTQVIGTVIASNINLNPPLAAAFATVPILVVVLYLFLARKSGALKHF
ncbi:ABC transporter permease [Galactobacter valiniphilus]|uniref:ABC transporter permease n=1 Tax=Galactobacter valiniphilus TaxID=2676122 RepID=UPI003735881E